MSEEKKRKFNPDCLMTWFVRITAAPSLLWFRPKRIYENDRARKKIHGGAILICNHVSFFDPIYAMLIIWYRVHHFICTDDLLVNRFVSFFLRRVCQCIPIDRDNFGMQTFNEITDQLKAGHLVTMYPEGHVQQDAKAGMQSFRSGMVLMALRAGCPIVPMYIRPGKKKTDRLKAVIGEPVMITSENGKRPGMKEIERITERLFEKVEQLGRMVEQ